MPPSTVSSPVNPTPYGAYPNTPVGPHVPLGSIPAAAQPHLVGSAVSQQHVPQSHAPHSGPVVSTVSKSPRVGRTSSKKSPVGFLISIALGGIVGVGAAGYLISRTNFVTQVRQDLGVEKTPEQTAREREAFEKALDEALNTSSSPTVPSERLRPSGTPSSSGARTDGPAQDNKKSFGKLARQSGDGQSASSDEMPDDPSRDSMPGPPRATFSDLIDPETGEPRPTPNTPGESENSASPGAHRSHASHPSITLPPVDSQNAVDVLALSADRSFDPQHFRLLLSAVQLPAGSEFAVTATGDGKGSAVVYRATASPEAEVAVFREDGKTLTFTWADGNVPGEIREQLRNAMVAYTTPTGVKHVALRACQAIERAVLDVEKERMEWNWPIDVPPKASEMYIEFGSLASLPHGAEMRGSNNELKVGVKGFISFRDFAGAQLTIGSSFKKGEVNFSLTPEFVERDGDRFNLAMPQLDEFEKNWGESIARNNKKLAQIEAQAAIVAAQIERIEASSAGDQAQAAAMVAQKRAALQKIQGLRTGAASTIKANNQLQARLKELPNVRQAVGKLKGISMSPFVIYAKVGNQRIELLEHNP